MKIGHQVKKEDIVLFVPKEPGPRTRYAKWEASSADGRSRDDGIVDLKPSA